MEIECRNCKKAHNANSGGARELCPRCWKYERRHGSLPPPEPIRKKYEPRDSLGLVEQLQVKVQPELLRKLEALAVNQGLPMRVMLRQVLWKLVRNVSLPTDG